ncbi:hypothetical protein ACCT04_34285, partial [Rhizobium ruizarguesonis]
SLKVSAIMPSPAQRNRPGEPGGGADMSTWRAIVPMTVVAHGFLAGVLHTAVQTRAPGFATRAISLAAAAISRKIC